MWTTFFLLLGFSSKISSVCRHSFQTLCDNFEDYYPIMDSVTELIVGSENKDRSHLMSINKDIVSLNKMVNLKSMTILGKVNDIEKVTFLGKINMPLDYLKFYGNNIKRLRPFTFTWMRVKRFSFENNNLEVLQGYAFSSCSFLTVDLSYNKLEEIDDDVLSDQVIEMFGTEEMIITHNKLTVIKPNSFPTRLKILKLDYNKLTYLERIFDNLKFLEELTVSHNEVDSIPNLNHAQRLTHIDFSFNKITYLKSKDFEKLLRLELVNLNHNQISNPDVLDTFVPSVNPQIEIKFALAYNYLTHLTRNQTLTNLTPILYGNPWICKCWPKIQDLIPNRDECDLRYFGNGNAPYCIEIADADCTSKLNVSDVTPLLPFLKLRDNAKANCSLVSEEPIVFVY